MFDEFEKLRRNSLFDAYFLTVVFTFLLVDGVVDSNWLQIIFSVIAIYFSGRDVLTRHALKTKIQQWRS